jgi:hypothetical protein
MRQISPSELRRRQTVRLNIAEMNRDKTVAERRQKAMVASNRIKLRSEKEALRLAQVEQALEERLREADRRHNEYLKVIKGIRCHRIHVVLLNDMLLSLRRSS